MRGNIFKRAAAVVVAVCMSVTFIPLAGDFAFADESDDPAIEAEALEETPAAPEIEAAAEEIEAAEETAVEENDQNGETGGNADEVTEEEAWVIEGDHVYYLVNGDPVTGEYEIDGVTYLFDEEGALQVTGKQEICGATYYFGEGGAIQKGWITTGEGMMYAGEDGKLCNGLATIGTDKYYFVQFVMQKGIKKVGGKLYYFQTNGKAILKTGWFTCPDNTKRYFLDGGVIAEGVKKIDSKLYFFNISTGSLRGKGFFDYNGKSYYCKGSGVLATGWQALTRDGKLNGYYFYKSSGAMAKGTTIGYLKIPKSGKLHEAYALGIKKLNSTKWTLKQAYKNSYKIKYQGRWWRQKTSEQYAMKGFKKNKGNCYVMAATFYIQAKLLGYNVRQIRGKVAHRYPHSWTQIKKKGSKKWKVYDPNFKNETGRNGWNIYYGKKGTWRYTNYSVFQN